jgi:hypothetical protein
MKKKIYKFFFRNRAEDYLFLPFFRLAIGLFAFMHFMFMKGDFYRLYDSKGIVDGYIMSAFKPDIVPNVIQTGNILFGWTNLSEHGILTAFFCLYLILCTFLTLGLFSRLSAFLLLLVHLIIFKGAPLYSYGVDNITSIVLFYCLLFPVGAQYSIDQLFQKKASITPSPYRRILQLHLCIIYSSSGFDKLIGRDWRNGEAIWQSIHLLKFDLPFTINYDFLATHSWVAMILSLGTVTLEIFYPVLLFHKRLRYWGLISVLFLHFGIAITMGLYFFSILMCLLSILAFFDLDKRLILPKKT